MGSYGGPYWVRARKIYFKPIYFYIVCLSVCVVLTVLWTVLPEINLNGWMDGWMEEWMNDWMNKAVTGLRLCCVALRCCVRLCYIWWCRRVLLSSFHTSCHWSRRLCCRLFAAATRKQVVRSTRFLCLFVLLSAG